METDQGLSIGSVIKKKLKKDVQIVPNIEC